MSARAVVAVLVLAAPAAAFARAPVAARAVGNDVAWARDSVEYAAACATVYRAAGDAVAASAKARRGPWAVVFDVDETVLSNAAYFVERGTAPYSPESFAAWLDRDEAPALAGAAGFVEAVRGLGGRVVFLTDRPAETEAATVAALRHQGLWKDGDLLLLRLDDADTKEVRRRCVETGKGRCAAAGPAAIAALLGDNIRDFVEVSGSAEAARLRAGAGGDPRWGATFFMLPNPMYGGWQDDYR